MSDLLGLDELPTRKSASHGEAGYARVAGDFYPTEPWVTEALCDAVDLIGTAIDDPASVWEPACGDGRMARVLESRLKCAVISTDLFDRGYGVTGVDFLGCPRRDCDAIVTNPPFDLARAFIVRALECTESRRGKVAILQRHEFDAPKSNHLLFVWPFACKLILPRRPRWSESDKASPRFPYAWYLWDWHHSGPPTIRWLP